MKTSHLFLLVPALWLTSSLQAQTQDTTANRERQERNVAPHGAFRDENGDGIDDRIERRGKGKGAKKDRFVDADGDGICDERTGGLGFRRGAGAAGQAGSAAGKGSGAGNRHGQGGKK
ncbi:MAG: hypothetical protein H6Q31_1886 [Bacteroidetes bacterium]|nr:hypothetical protein [Bacteroidota bacterium]